MILITLFLVVWYYIPFGHSKAIGADNEPSTHSLTLIYISNMPNIESREGVGGLAELATLVRRERASKTPCLFFHGGDSLGPSALSSFDRGAHMVDLLNRLAPDAMAVAKREFSYREDQFILRTYEAAFPMLNANIMDPLNDNGPIEGVEPFQCYTVDGVTLCAFAVVDPEMIRTFRPDRIHIFDTSRIIRQTAKALRKQGADLVILMTGYDVPEKHELLEKGDIDILFQSDSRMDSVIPTKRGLLIHQGTDNRKAVMVDLLIKGQKDQLIWDHQVAFHPLASFPADPEVQTQCNTYLNHLSILMEKRLGVTRTALDTTRSAVRTAENAFGNLAADALREWHDVEIAIINGGGIRGNRTYSPGAILTRRDIQSELPFRNSSIVIRVTGKQLLHALENGLSRLRDEKGCFPHVSGLKVSYDPHGPVGKRVQSVHVTGNTPKVLNLDQSYLIATLDYLADGGDGYEAFKGCEQISTPRGSQLLWEILRTYLEARGHVNPTIEGRLEQVKQ